MKKLALLGIVLLMLAGCKGKAVNNNTDVTVAEAKALAEENKTNPDFIILDVRTPAEYEAGHIDGAVNIDVSQNSFYGLVSKLDKEKAYLVYCRSGNRSKQALSLMNRAGFTKIYHMKDGYSQWH